MAIARNVLVLIVDNTPDSDGHVFEAAGIELPPVEVPVTYNFDRELTDILGYATLKKGGDGNIYADIDFRGPNTQVDALAKLTPAIGCVAFELSRVFERTVIDRCRIDRVGCSPSRNADPRIPTLGDQRVFEGGSCRRSDEEFFVPPGTDVAR